MPDGSADDGPGLEDIAAVMNLLDAVIAEGTTLTTEQRIAALAGALRSSLGVLDTLLAASPHLGDEDAMVARSICMINGQILDYCGSG